MKPRNSLYPMMLAAALLAAPAVHAADHGHGLDGLEMDVLDEHAAPNDASTKTLALPDAASDTAREHAQRGLDKANAAREDGAAFGESASEAASGGTHGKPDGTPGGRP